MKPDFQCVRTTSTRSFIAFPPWLRSAAIEDFAEGIAVFGERRQPAFRGR